MADVTEYTIFDIATREVKYRGKGVRDKVPYDESTENIYWGERVNFETHIFDGNDLPVQRETPRLRPEVELAIEINRERNRRVEEGREFFGVWVTGRDKDQTVMLGLKDTARDLKDAGINAAVLPFKDGKNIEHMLTADEFIAIHNAGKQFVTSVYQASWALKLMNPIPQDTGNDEYWP